MAPFSPWEVLINRDGEEDQTQCDERWNVGVLIWEVKWWLKNSADLSVDKNEGAVFFILNKFFLILNIKETIHTQQIKKGEQGTKAVLRCNRGLHILFS